MDHSTENLEHFSAAQSNEPQKEVYTERPISHRIAAFLLIIVVLVAFLGTCYWLAAYGRV